MLHLEARKLNNMITFWAHFPWLQSYRVTLALSSFPSSMLLPSGYVNECCDQIYWNIVYVYTKLSWLLAYADECVLPHSKKKRKKTKFSMGYTLCDDAGTLLELVQKWK